MIHRRAWNRLRDDLTLPTNGGHGNYTYVMVVALPVTLPLLILFAFRQRCFLYGVATEGRKG